MSFCYSARKVIFMVRCEIRAGTVRVFCKTLDLPNIQRLADVLRVQATLYCAYFG